MKTKQQYTKKELKERKKVLDILLKPIKWNWSSGTSYRRHLVSTRREPVLVVYPFLNNQEKKRADYWLKKEKHDGLWD